MTIQEWVERNKEKVTIIRIPEYARDEGQRGDFIKVNKVERIK